MTKEELKEMIDSTIAGNGNGTITGAALNLALNAIVDAMGTGSGAGGGRIYLTLSGNGLTTTNEDRARNAELYAKIVAALESGDPVNAYVCVDEGGTIQYIGFSLLALVDGMIGFISSEISLTLASDGSVKEGI